MLLPNDCICRADQSKPRIKSHIKRFGNTVFGLNTVHSHTHTYTIYIYIYIYIYIIFARVIMAPLYRCKLKM